MVAVEITWIGDLDDDCTAEWNGYGAHAEAMSDYLWYCSVWKLGGKPASYIFHSSTDGIHPNSHKAARTLCEFIMRAAVAGIVFPSSYD